MSITNESHELKCISKRRHKEKEAFSKGIKIRAVVSCILVEARRRQWCTHKSYTKMFLDINLNSDYPTSQRKTLMQIAKALPGRL